MPAPLDQRGDGQGGDRDDGNTPFRGHTGMAGRAEEADIEPVAASGADCDLFHSPTIEVEGQLRPAQSGGLDRSGAPQANLLLNGEEKRQRRMGEVTAQNLHRRRQHHRHPSPIIGSEACGGIAAFDKPPRHHRLGPQADWNGIHVGHQEPPGAGERAGQVDD